MPDPADQFPDGFFQPQESTIPGAPTVLPQDQHFPPNVSGVGTVDVPQGSIIRTDTQQSCGYTCDDHPIYTDGACTYWKVTLSCQCLKVTYLIKPSGDEEKLPDDNQWESCGIDQVFLVIVCPDESQPGKKKSWRSPWIDDYDGIGPFPDPPVKMPPVVTPKPVPAKPSPPVPATPAPVSSAAKPAPVKPVPAPKPPVDSDPPLMGPNPTLWGKIKWVWWMLKPW